MRNLNYTTLIELYTLSGATFPFWVEPWNARHFRALVKDFGAVEKEKWIRLDPMDCYDLGYKHTKFLCDLYSLKNNCLDREGVHIEAYRSPCWRLSDYPARLREEYLEGIYEEGMKSVAQQQRFYSCPYEVDSDEYWAFERGRYHATTKTKS